MNKEEVLLGQSKVFHTGPIHGEELNRLSMYSSQTGHYFQNYGLCHAFATALTFLIGVLGENIVTLK